MDWLDADGCDLQRDINRYYIDSWIKFNIHLDSGERKLHVGPNDFLIVLPAIPYPDEEEQENTDEQEFRKAA